MYVHSCNALSARFSAVYRALNSYFMIFYDYNENKQQQTVNQPCRASGRTKDSCSH